MIDSALSTSPQNAYAAALADNATTDTAMSPAQVTANVRKATLSRLGFAVVMAILAAAVLPSILELAWVAVLALWEYALRPWIEDRFALPASARDEAAGFRWLAAIHFIGGLGYTLFPVTLWLTGDTMGMVLATAWICGSANHVFVYFTPNRLLVAACIGPLAACALAAPFMAGGFTLQSVVGAATLGALILAAAMFGLDRRVLLSNLARQTAARTAAEDANLAKSQFLATMSHELRTPLNAVIGYAELIEEDAPAGSIKEDASKITESARQLLITIDTILDLSRLETGAIELERELCDGAVVLEQIRETAAPLAAINNNKLTIDGNGGLGEAWIDQRRVYQCLFQLVANAAKFTHNGAIGVTGARRLIGGRDMLVFEVTDTGVGISADQQKRIFEAFTQSAGRNEGAGLGLTLVRRLARQMGGDVVCASAPGQGSTFTLWVAAAEKTEPN